MSKQLSLGPLFRAKKKQYGLTKSFMPKNKRWLMECDYADSLSDYDRKWLDQFNREFVDGAVKKNDPFAIHKTDELRKECYRDNNARNRDLFAIKQCSNILVELEDHLTPHQGEVKIDFFSISGTHIDVVVSMENEAVDNLFTEILSHIALSEPQHTPA